MKWENMEENKQIDRFCTIYLSCRVLWKQAKTLGEDSIAAKYGNPLFASRNPTVFTKYYIFRGGCRLINLYAVCRPKSLFMTRSYVQLLLAQMFQRRIHMGDRK